MKLFHLVLITVICCTSCQDEKNLLEEVSINLLDLSSVQYISELEIKSDNKIIYDIVDTLSMDFRKDNSNNLKYNLKSDQS